jgi:hypothetical protein
VRRVEGVIPGDDYAAYVADVLDEWAAQARGVDGSALAIVPRGYFLGSTYSVVADVPDRQLRVAAAYEPYSWEAPERGGSVLLAALDGIADGEQNGLPDLAWFSEIVFEDSDQPFLTTTYARDGISVAVSDAWEVELEPGPAGNAEWDYVLNARAPDGSPKVEIYQRPDAELGGVKANVDDWIERLESGDAGLGDVRIESREEVNVPGAVAAELVRYSWLVDGQRWFAWDLNASDGETLTEVYIGDWESDRWKIQSTVEALLRSFAIAD